MTLNVAAAAGAASGLSSQAPPAAIGGALFTTSENLKESVDAALNRLLSVSSTFKDLQPGKDRNVSTREETIAMMQHYLARLDLTQTVNDKLSVIHISGTKGKGSTCAMVERILRQAGYKTGLFTSPHLISPCERFRINGKPISEQLFLKHFNAVWDGLERTADQSGEYPPMAWFFRFLTLMALHTFAEEQVDVVILEVGIGGRLDATNVVPKPVVCGVTTLDLDHTQILGNTLDKIAYAKGGIFKKGVPAFTSAQPPLAMDMLHKCAEESQTTVLAVPSLDAMGPDGASCELGLQGNYQRTNAGLAATLAAVWLQHKRSTENNSQPVDFSTVLEPVVKEGLKHAFWPARSHQVNDLEHASRFYIDGAHTLRSIECCAEWYGSSTAKSPPQQPLNSKRVLFFTIHHERNVAGMLAPLLEQGFDRAYFCPTGASRPSLAKVLTFSEVLRTADLDHVLAKYSPEELQALDDVEDMGKLQWQTTLARVWASLTQHLGTTGRPCSVHVKPSVVDCIEELRAEAENGVSYDILVTGSLYLAGETLQFLNWRE